MNAGALGFPSGSGPALARLRVRISPAFCLSGCPPKRNQKGEGFHAERGQRKAGEGQFSELTPSLTVSRGTQTRLKCIILKSLERTPICIQGNVLGSQRMYQESC